MNILSVMPYLQANLSRGEGMASGSLLDWSLSCGLEICGLFANDANDIYYLSLFKGLPQQVFCQCLSFSVFKNLYRMTENNLSASFSV